MFWDRIWHFLKSLWNKIVNRKTSGKANTTLDTVSVKVFGLDIKVTREVPVEGPPYELTVVVPRAEVHSDKNSGKSDVVLSSITVAHSPRFEGRTPPAKPVVPGAQGAV